MEALIFFIFVLHLIYFDNVIQNQCLFLRLFILRRLKSILVINYILEIDSILIVPMNRISFPRNIVYDFCT